eukprot:2502491-Amphidinium_carterae.1
MGAPPAVYKECSLAQLSAIKCLLTEEVVPCVDFSFWVPQHVRMQKKLAFSGFIIGADGSLRRAEIKGPSKFSGLRRSALVPCGAVGGALPGTLGLIYSADAHRTLKVNFRPSC